MRQKKQTRTVRRRLIVRDQVNNRPPKNWEEGCELVVSFQYGLDEQQIAKTAGLRNYDTGITLATGVRDLMFPCGTNIFLARRAANRLLGADRFGALRIRISYPTQTIGKDTFTSWYSPDGTLLERVKHRKLINHGPAGKRRTNIRVRRAQRVKRKVA